MLIFYKYLFKVKSLIKRAFLFLLLTLSLNLNAQDPVIKNTQDSSNRNTVEMADALRKSGKIYIVVVVLIIILGGMFLYLIRIDRKIGRVEDELRNTNDTNRV
ncbi:MAG: hypothetical protein FVQ77_10825 [Cytophagales bacterium]|nr:hypothetical protein [Cytophagales bacterium]